MNQSWRNVTKKNRTHDFDLFVFLNYPEKYDTSMQITQLIYGDLERSNRTTSTNLRNVRHQAKKLMQKIRKSNPTSQEIQQIL